LPSLQDFTRCEQRDAVLPAELWRQILEWEEAILGFGISIADEVLD